jgi:hypothetical protein
MLYGNRAPNKQYAILLMYSCYLIASKQL